MKLHIFVCIVYECTHVRLEQLSMGLCFRQYFGKIVVESTGTILGYQTYISTSATTTGGKMKESHQANALNIINIRQAY